MTSLAHGEAMQALTRLAAWTQPLPDRTREVEAAFDALTDFICAVSEAEVARTEAPVALWGHLSLTTGRIVAVRSSIGEPTNYVQGRKWVPLYMAPPPAQYGTSAWCGMPEAVGK